MYLLNLQRNKNSNLHHDMDAWVKPFPTYHTPKWSYILKSNSFSVFCQSSMSTWDSLHCIGSSLTIFVSFSSLSCKLLFTFPCLHLSLSFSCISAAVSTISTIYSYSVTSLIFPSTPKPIWNPPSPGITITSYTWDWKVWSHVNYIKIKYHKN